MATVDETAASAVAWSDGEARTAMPNRKIKSEYQLQSQHQPKNQPQPKFKSKTDTARKPRYSTKSKPVTHPSIKGGSTDTAAINQTMTVNTPVDTAANPTMRVNPTMVANTTSPPVDTTTFDSAFPIDSRSAVFGALELFYAAICRNMSQSVEINTGNLVARIILGMVNKQLQKRQCEGMLEPCTSKTHTGLDDALMCIIVNAFMAMIRSLKLGPERASDFTEPLILTFGMIKMDPRVSGDNDVHTYVRHKVCCDFWNSTFDSFKTTAASALDANRQ